MYAAKDCRVFSSSSEGGKEISTLKKGDKVTVSKVGDWNTVELDNGKEGFVKKENLSDTMPEKDQGESASTQPVPAPTPEPTPQPQPAPEQPQANSGGISDAERDALIQMAIDAGATVGDVTGEVTEFHVDGETSVDISNVTVH